MNRILKNDEFDNEYIRDFVLYVVLGSICIVIAILLYEMTGDIRISMILPALLYVYVAYKKEEKRKFEKSTEIISR